VTPVAPVAVEVVDHDSAESTVEVNVSEGVAPEATALEPL
jgi:hypothetical protein